MSKTVKVKHETASSFSVDGRTYVVGKGGVFEMSEGDAAMALDAGFTQVVEADKPAAKTAKGGKAAE